MQAHQLRPLDGVLWITEGLRLYKRYPLAMLSLPMTYFWGVMLLSFLPVVGNLLAVILAPGLAVGLMRGALATATQERPTPMMLFSALKHAETSKPLLIQGGIFIVGLAVALGVSVLVDAGEFAQAVLMGSQESESPTVQTQADVGQSGFWVFLGLMLPVFSAFWFGPVLLAWHRLGITQALFYSLVACWRNRWAFLVFFAAWFLGSIPLSLILKLIVTVFQLDFQSALVFVMMPVSLVLVSVFQLTHFVCYSQIFEGEQARIPSA